MIAAEGIDETSLVFIVFFAFVVIYIFTGWLLYRIGRKLGYPKSWYAWVPIANFYMIVDLSYRDTTKWFLLIIILGIIPVVNLVALVMEIMVIMDICQRCGKGRWWAILWLIPVINLVVLLILGSGKAPKPAVVKGEWSPEEHPAFQGYTYEKVPQRKGTKPMKPREKGKPPSSSSWV